MWTIVSFIKQITISTTGMNLLKSRVFSIIDSEKHPNRYSEAFDSAITFLILLSIFGIILESYESIATAYKREFYIFEIFTIIVFSLEYLLRLWTANLKYPQLSPIKARLKFIGSWMAIVDLVAILPFFIPLLFANVDFRFIRILRIFRLLRVLKLYRYSKSLQLVIDVCIEKRHSLGVTLFVTIVLLLISSTLMYYLEHEVQPESFPDILSSFWWAIATLTTVGYGDVYPITAAGKLVSGLIAILGIILVALPTGILSAAFMEKLDDDEATTKANKVNTPENFKYCPYCGKPLVEDEKKEQ